VEFSLGKNKQASIVPIRESRPIELRRVRDMYRFGKGSHLFLDFLMRTAMNFGSWSYSCGIGLREGYAAFNKSRDWYRDEFRKAPPIHVTASQVSEDLATAIEEGRVRWEE
jgi:hypothetical protein